MLALGYILLDFLVVALLMAIGIFAINRTIKDETKQKKKKIQLLVAMGLWQLYIFLIASSGFLLDYSFPPRFVLCLVLPALTGN